MDINHKWHNFIFWVLCKQAYNQNWGLVSAVWSIGPLPASFEKIRRAKPPRFFRAKRFGAPNLFVQSNNSRAKLNCTPSTLIPPIQGTSPSKAGRDSHETQPTNNYYSPCLFRLFEPLALCTHISDRRWQHTFVNVVWRRLLVYI